MIATLAVLDALSSPIEIAYHADLEGQMATPRCGEPGDEELDYAALVAAIDGIRADATARSGSAPIALLGGDELGPDLFVRGIIKRDGDEGARDVAALFARAQYDAITLGNHDLSFEPEQLERFAATFARTNIPIVVSNLHCDASRRGLCAHIRADAMVVRGSDKIGILGVISPATLATIAKPLRAGLTLDELAPAITAGVARLRGNGATLVVAMVQVNSGPRGVDEVLKLQRALSETGAPVVILSSGMSDVDGQHPTLLVRQDRSPPVIGSASGPVGVTHVTIAPGSDALAVDASFVRSRTDARDPATTELLARHVAKYCERYGKPFGTSGTAPTTKPGLLAYTLAVMQHVTSAEIAFVNNGLVYARAFPMVGQLTRAKLKRAMPHAAVVGTISVPGAALADLLAAGESFGRLAMIGAARPAAGKPFTINGRPIDRTRSYRIATIDFVAQGGDGGFAAEQFASWRPWEGHPDVRELVEAELTRGTTFDTPASRLLLTSAIGDLAVDLTDTNIANASSLGDPQLARAEQQAIKLELNAVLQLDHPDHRWDTRANLKYGYARTRAPGTDAAAQETLDLVQITSQYNYRGLFRSDDPSAIVPSPYTRVFLETELTVPSTRMYRHAELTHTFGAQLTVASRLKLRVGAGYRTELLARSDSPDPNEADLAGFRVVAEAGAAVDPFAIATFRRLAITAEGTVDYFLLDPGGRTEHQLRASGKLSLPLLPLLFLTAGFDVFAVDRDSAGRGASFDTTVGIKVHLDATHQAL